MFHSNFGKIGPIFKNFHQLIREKVTYVTHKDFHLTCDTLLHYPVKVKNPRMLLILTACSTNC